MRKRVDELLRLLHENETVEKIAKATDKVAEYHSQKELLLEKIQDFKKEVKRRNYDFTSEYILDVDDDILSENSLQICVLCIMIQINECDLIPGNEELPEILRRIEGELAHIAGKFAEFLDDFDNYFSQYEEDKLIDMFFN